jgi:site-specific DNA-methyltransferase (adenine-specific)
METLMNTPKYSILLADPPWDFVVWNRDTGNGRSPSAHYQTMNLDDICALPISNLTERDCALFLWCVWPRLFDAERVIRSWGFTYKTLAWIWVKKTKLNNGYHTGMGYYTRANSEPCLLAVKGRMPVAAHDVLSLIVSPVRGHSQKPDEQYAKIARLYPDGNRLELFARARHPGWDVFGNEVENSIVLEEK